MTQSVAVCRKSLFRDIKQLQLNDQILFELRVYLDILVAVRVHNHPGLPEREIEGIVRMTMDPQVGTMVDTSGMYRRQRG